QVAHVIEGTDSAGPVQPHPHGRVVRGGVHGPYSEALQAGVGSQAAAAAPEVANEELLLEVIGVGKPGVSSVPVARLDVGHKGFDSFLGRDRKSTRLNSSHQIISYAV